jgi:hypothetical protein
MIYILKNPGMVTVKFTFTPKTPATFIYKVIDLQNMAMQCPTHPVDMHPNWPRMSSFSPSRTTLLSLVNSNCNIMKSSLFL